MKKAIFYLSSVILACMVFTSCEDPYANQKVAEPGGYEQEALLDTNFVAVVKAGVSPFTILKTQLTDSVALFNCTSVMTLLDSTSTISYKLSVSNTIDFVTYKSIPSSFNGKSGSDIKVSYKDLNDTIKGFNKNAVERTVYARLLAYIVNGGTKTVFKTKVMTLVATPYNYPPVAFNDVVTTLMGTPVIISVLDNDTDVEKDVLTVASKTTPAHGTLTLDADGKLTYTPTPGYSGTDSFNYTINDGNGNTSTATVDITIPSTKPFTAVTPRPYYIIGMADGAWNNSVAGIGKSIYPLSFVPGNNYNDAGDGEYTFTGYFYANRGFKLIRDPGNWDEQWGNKNGVFVHNDGGSSDIKVATDGYYTITLNSISNTMTMIPALVTPTTYTKIGLIGDINDWGSDELMTASETSNNHIWYTTYTFTKTTGEVKFRANGNWDISWGGSSFPNGIGATSNVPNIGYSKGTYTVIFNDISGSYNFIKQQ